MWQHDTQGCTVRKGGGGKEKSACFHWRDASVLNDDKCEHILAAEWMNEWNEEEKPKQFAHFAPSYLVNTGEWPSESRPRE